MANNFPELTDAGLIDVARSAVNSYRYVTELPYFMHEDSSEYEPMLLALRAAANLARSAVEPVPFAELQPRQEDCDAQGKCWWFGNLTRGQKHWFYASGDGGWTQHWLPYWAISSPATREGV